MGNLIIKRKCYKRVRSAYSLEINQEYVDRINKDIYTYIVDPESFEPLTLEEVQRIAFDETHPIEDDDPNSRLILQEIEFYFFCKSERKDMWKTSLLWFVKDTINQDLWDSDEEIEREDIDDTEDEVFYMGFDAADDDMNLNN